MYQLAFYIGDFSNPDAELFDRAVCIWTRSRFSHVEMVFSDGMSFSSSPRDGGCRFKEIDYNKPSHWVLFPIPWITEYDEQEIRAFCINQDGTKYDWTGIFLSQVLPLNIQEPNRWFCSEIAANSLKAKRPAQYNPGSLYEMVRKHI